MGQSSQNTQTTQQSSTSPWATGQSVVNPIISQLNPLIANSGTTPGETSSINQLTALGNAGNPYADGSTSAVNSLLSGGNATAQAPAVQSALQNYTTQTNPLASNTDYNPYDTPGFSQAIAAMNTGIGNQINGQFAAGGRIGSGMNTQTLAQGEALGDSQAIASQYNANVAAQQGAAQNLFGAGNTAASTIAGMNQNAATNQNTGINAAGTALGNSLWGPQTALTAQQLQQSLPASNLGILAQIGIPIAGLGTNSTGSGTSNTTGNPSFLQDLNSLSSSFSNFLSPFTSKKSS
jgi:hypothetical protein